MRKKLIQTGRVPQVRPKQSRFTISNCASCHGFITVNEPQIALPPKGSFPFLPRQDAIVIVSLPNQVDPRNILPIIKFVKVFKQKSLILHKDVHHSKATLIFWSTNSGSCYHSKSMVFQIWSPPKTMSQVFFNLVFDGYRHIKAAHEIYNQRIEH